MIGLWGASFLYKTILPGRLKAFRGEVLCGFYRMQMDLVIHSRFKPMAV